MQHWAEMGLKDLISIDSFHYFFPTARIIGTPMKICFYSLSCWDTQYYTKFADSIHHKNNTPKLLLRSV